MSEWRCQNCSLYNKVEVSICRKCSAVDLSDAACGRFFLQNSPVLSSKENGMRYLKGMRSAPLADVMKLFSGATKEKRVSQFQEALSLDDSPEFFKRDFISLLDFLGKDELSTGLRSRVRDQILMAVFETPMFMDVLVESVKNIEKKDTLAWFVSMLLKIKDELKRDPMVERLIEVLLEDQSIKARFGSALSCKSTDTDGSLQSFKERAGGRNDNDFEDFREIQVIPSTNEVLCSTSPFLPSPNAAGTPHDLLDRQFRLFREDFVGTVREELALLVGSKVNDKKWLDRIRSRTFSNVSFKEILLNKRDLCSATVSFDQPAGAKGALPSFWKEKTRLLSKDSLVCFFENDALLCFGTVQVREVESLKLESPSIGVRFHSERDNVVVLGRLGRNEAASVKMVQMSASIFSYVPVLDRLKALTQPSI